MSDRRSGPLTRRQVAQLAAVVAGGWAVGLLVRRTAPVGRTVDDAADAAAALHEDGGPVTGPSTASLRLAVFTDYRCPACRRAFRPLEDAVAEDGDVRLLYKDWPIFGPLSERAARIALAAIPQGRYHDVHRGLMTEPHPLGEPLFRPIVEAAGADWARLSADLVRHEPAITARLLQNGRQARALALPGTPAYLAGSRLALGALDTAGFARLFTEARVA